MKQTGFPKGRKGYVVDHIVPEEQLVLLTSDHGNIEDLSRKVHTLNSVPTIAWGKGCREALRRISSIQAVTPAILYALGTDWA